MAHWPPSLRPIAKYMARAREVEQSHPLVAYYCNCYSLKRAVVLRDPNDPSTNEFLRGLLEKCDIAKQAIGEDDGTHLDIVSSFALSVFERADNEDREGRATKTTAHTFYAAMCFFEVCQNFGELRPDLEERLRYAKWKAADIFKAIREGRAPTPGAPGQSDPSMSQPQQQQPQTPIEAPQLPATPPNLSRPSPFTGSTPHPPLTPSSYLSAPATPPQSHPQTNIPPPPEASFGEPYHHQQEYQGSHPTDVPLPTDIPRPPDFHSFEQHSHPEQSPYPSAGELPSNPSFMNESSRPLNHQGSPHHKPPFSYPSPDESPSVPPHSNAHSYAYPASGSTAYPHGYPVGTPNDKDSSNSSLAPPPEGLSHPVGYPSGDHGHMGNGSFQSNDGGVSLYPANSGSIPQHYNSPAIQRSDDPVSGEPSSTSYLEGRFGQALHLGGHGIGPQSSHAQTLSSQPPSQQRPHAYGGHMPGPLNGHAPQPPSPVPAFPGMQETPTISTPNSGSNASAPSSIPSLANRLPLSVSSAGAKVKQDFKPPGPLPQSTSMPQISSNMQGPPKNQSSQSATGGGRANSNPSFRPSPTKIREAQRLSRDAVSALDFQDIASARNFLESALKLLNGES